MVDLNINIVDVRLGPGLVAPRACTPADAGCASRGPERLSAFDEHAPRHAKRVLAALTGGDAERETRCWSEADLALLEGRGGGCGLADFITEVEQKLCPQIDNRSRPTST